MSNPATPKQSTVKALLLVRRGRVFIEEMLRVGGGERAPAEAEVTAIELALADVGYVLSSRLRARLVATTDDARLSLRAWALPALSEHMGGGQKHEPLFRQFPVGAAVDTAELWWRKVLVHFLQVEGQPCLHCRRSGTTHVLRPCRHVVCDLCFDGANYSACPVCEHHVDRSSPFFEAIAERGRPAESIVFKLIDLGEDETDEARALFVSLCERRQPLSPGDRAALVTILRELGEPVLSWLPAVIPVRQNVATVFGTLFQALSPRAVVGVAGPFLRSATDVLRLIAVLSGTDGSLARHAVSAGPAPAAPVGWQARLDRFFSARSSNERSAPVSRQIARFKMVKLSRALRRALLGLLEGFDPDRLLEDLLRHRSYWVWVGEFLHPHEYASRFPKVARAFQIVRKKAPDGTTAPRALTWRSRLEASVRDKDADRMMTILEERPGELARRLDHALRSARDEEGRARVTRSFVSRSSAFATPVLVTLRSHLPTRSAPAPVRIFWPKGEFAMGVSRPDRRALLSEGAIAALVEAIDAELLRRFAEKPAFEIGVLDDALRTVRVPFSEATASVSAVSLPRGSRIAVPEGKLMRLFLHWCEPQKEGLTTDLDLSVALYDEAWRYVGVCSYYQLTAAGLGETIIAESSGDLRDGPWPDGASEFVDLHRDLAMSSGVRYAVMVVNNYSGMPFSKLERAFAGLMLREDPGGQHFDARTAELKFELSGECGVFLPFVVDVREGALHWLDVYRKGALAMNNVETSKAAIAKVCPELLAYFGSGTRASMFELGRLHVAARCQRVFIRGEGTAEYVRRSHEDAAAFYRRLVAGEADRFDVGLSLSEGPPVLSVLYRGDVDLPGGSLAYALFRERVLPSLAASDLLS